MKFIHMADLHLGSPFAGLPPHEAAKRYSGQFDVLDAALRAAVSSKARLVLISGDVFDDTVVSRKTVSGFFDRLGSYPGISFVISPGNHDYYTPEGYYSETDAKIPGNVFVFRTPELSRFEFPGLGADVYGFAFTSDSMFVAPSLTPDTEDGGRIKILCCHAALDDPSSPYCPVYSSALGFFDYAALGHIHARGVSKLGKTTIAYPGCPEGRDFGECGKKGVLLVDTAGGEISVSFIRMPGVTYRAEEFDLTGVLSRDALTSSLHDLISRLDDADKRASTALRVTLTGVCDPSLDPDAQSLAFGLRDRFAADPFLEIQIKDETVPGYRAEELEKDISLRGCYYRALRPELESADPAVRLRAARALRMGLNAIDGLPVMR
ncbi:MAG: exonuclease SbcCD subunit D [Clostridia bacterium]|nr:exonuclease SbcCD subunit D [Clostridia bacterium]